MPLLTCLTGRLPGSLFRCAAWGVSEEDGSLASISALGSAISSSMIGDARSPSYGGVHTLDYPGGLSLQSSDGGCCLLPPADPQIPRTSLFPSLCPLYPRRQVSLLLTHFPLRSVSSLAHPCPVHAPPFPSLCLLSPSLLEPGCKIKSMPSAGLLEPPAGDQPFLQLCCPQASGTTWARWLHSPGPQFLHLENGGMMAALHSGVFHGCCPGSHF